MTHAFILFCAVFLACILGLLLRNPVIVKAEEEWISALEKEGIDRNISKNLGHNQTDWFYFNKKICVGYGLEECDSRSKYCPKDNIDQIESIKLALSSGFEHPNCPLLY